MLSACCLAAPATHAEATLEPARQVVGQWNGFVKQAT